jgi:hypothetical protein
MSAIGSAGAFGTRVPGRPHGAGHQCMVRTGRDPPFPVAWALGAPAASPFGSAPHHALAPRPIPPAPPWPVGPPEVTTVIWLVVEQHQYSFLTASPPGGGALRYFFFIRARRGNLTSRV